VHTARRCGAEVQAAALIRWRHPMQMRQMRFPVLSFLRDEEQ